MTDHASAPARIHRIPLPTPYPVGRSNAYLIEGDPPVLVDCGVRSSKATQTLERALGEHRVRLEDVGAILLSHPHYDHAGAAADTARTSASRRRASTPTNVGSCGVSTDFRTEKRCRDANTLAVTSSMLARSTSS